ncbi:NUDIX domain-containing protein [Candidatus Pacearchaeota archaeon]|nr:NUDIX domain-containing protein [Candidatus Pacearchaeota archaeon]
MGIGEQGEAITPKVGVAVLLFENTGLDLFMLLGKRLSDHGKGQYSIPGGHVDMMEDLEVSCIREIFEETGLVISNVQKLEKYPYSATKFEETGKHYITLYFTADVVAGTLETKEPEKCEGWCWTNMNELINSPNPIGPLFKPLGKMLNDSDFIEYVKGLTK